MAYRIEYEKNPKYDRKSGLLSGRVGAMIAGFALAFVLLTKLFWPAGSDMLQKIFLPGDPEVNAAAFTTMTRELARGEDIADAIAVFCHEIIDNEKNPD